MKIAHVALWTSNLELQLTFWNKYFSGVPGEKFVSKKHLGFESYFVSLSDGSAIELMKKAGLDDKIQTNNHAGWIHVAVSVGSHSRVNEIAELASEEGILLSKPEVTEDGYFEAVIVDPDGNLIEVVP